MCWTVSQYTRSLNCTLIQIEKDTHFSSTFFKTPKTSLCRKNMDISWEPETVNIIYNWALRIFGSINNELDKIGQFCVSERFITLMKNYIPKMKFEAIVYEIKLTIQISLRILNSLHLLNWTVSERMVKWKRKPFVRRIYCCI